MNLALRNEFIRRIKKDLDYLESLGRHHAQEACYYTRVVASLAYRQPLDQEDLNFLAGHALAIIEDGVDNDSLLAAAKYFWHTGGACAKPIPKQEMVTIPKEEYDNLVKRSKTLSSIEGLIG